MEWICWFFAKTREKHEVNAYGAEWQQSGAEKKETRWKSCVNASWHVHVKTQMEYGVWSGAHLRWPFCMRDDVCMRISVYAIGVCIVVYLLSSTDELNLVHFGFDFDTEKCNESPIGTFFYFIKKCEHIYPYGYYECEPPECDSSSWRSTSTDISVKSTLPLSFFAVVKYKLSDNSFRKRGECNRNY